MTPVLNATHDPERRSWVESANAPDSDFPIQNLPFGRFRTTGGEARTGVALGDQIIDLSVLAESLVGLAGEAARAAESDLLPLLSQSAEAVSALRSALSDLYRADGPTDRALAQAALVPMAEVELLLPIRPPAFSDFCCSIDHIRRMAAGAGKGVAPVAMHLPVGYNSRASSVAVSGTPLVRPKGQYETRPGSGDVRYGPEPRLDYELELGVWLRGGNGLSEPISVAEAEASLFGICLLNDWSARGIQAFEQMLGPHLGKSFLTTVSPWILTMEALAPFRIAARGRTTDEPAVPGHLLDETDRSHGGFNIALTADLIIADGQSRCIATTNFDIIFWSLAQMVAHQASSGAPLEAGDLLGSGTISGPAETARACLSELTERGANPVIYDGDVKRVWLEDGDTVSIRGRAQAEGRVSIGFGACQGTVSPARPEP